MWAEDWGMHESVSTVYTQLVSIVILFSTSVLITSYWGGVFFFTKYFFDNLYSKFQRTSCRSASYWFLSFHSVVQHSHAFDAYERLISWFSCNKSFSFVLSGLLLELLSLSLQIYQLRLFGCPGYADLFTALYRCGLTSMGSCCIINNTHPTSFEFVHQFFHFPLAHVVTAMQNCSHPCRQKLD